MGKTTFKKENASKPAPRWWRKLEDGLLMILIPATVAVILGWGFTDEAFVTKLTLFINVGFVALIKFVGKMLANGEDYAPSANTFEKPSAPKDESL
jgi:hypothetical protein